MNQGNYNGPGEYVIKVKGHLDERKSYWFEGLTMIAGFDKDGRPIGTHIRYRHPNGQGCCSRYSLYL